MIYSENTDFRLSVVLIWTLFQFLPGCGQNDLPPGEDAYHSQDNSGWDTSDEDASAADLVEEQNDGPCPGSISCMDPELERPRAAICIDSGFPLETTCILLEDGSDACCVPPFSCESDEDCELARETESFCPDTRFACACNLLDGSCYSDLCAIDGDCGPGEICRSGVCYSGETELELVAWLISGPGVIQTEESRQLQAIAVNTDDRSLVYPDTPIMWESSASSIVSIDSSGLATGGSQEGQVTITARVMDNSEDPGMSITLTNYIEFSTGYRVTVIDENNGLPIEDATVFLQDETQTVTLTTDALGQAVYTGGELSTRDVTIIHDDYFYLTLAQVNSDNLLIPLTPATYTNIWPVSSEETPSETSVCEEDLTGETLCFDLEGVVMLEGFPTADLVANSGELDVAITGFGLSNQLLDLNFDVIVGPSIERDISGGPIPVDDLADIPSGVTMAFNEDPIVPSYLISRWPGVSTLWSLGGRVNLSENPNLLTEIIAQTEGDIDIGKILTTILPLFSEFYSGIEPDLSLSDVLDDQELPVIGFDNALTLPMSRRIYVQAPTVPLDEVDPLETVIFIAGASVPGRGFIPLGITAATDDPESIGEDGVFDGIPETPEIIDPLSLNMAPIHSGLESPWTQYTLIGMATSLESAADSNDTRQQSTGVVIHLEPGEFYGDLLDLSGNHLLSPAIESTFDVDSDTLTIVNSEADIAFYRLALESTRGHMWHIYLPPEAASAPYSLPALPDEAGLLDYVLEKPAKLLAARLAETGDLTDGFQQIIDFDGPGLMDLVNRVSEFSVVELGE